MKARATYTVTTVGATSVTLTPITLGAGFDEDQSGQPNIFGTGTILITQAVTPDANYWKVGRKILAEFSVVDG